jgi:hypothetical protein
MLVISGKWIQSFDQIKLIWVFIIFSGFHFCSFEVLADISRLRITGMGGLSQSQVVGANTNKPDNQGPMGISAHVDYLLSGQLEIGAEHLRTISSRNGAAVGLTGLSIKNYFWFSHPQTQIPEQDIRSQAIFKIQAFTPYIGGSAGIVQASILDRNIGALGGYVGLKGGIELPISDAWGLRTESNLSISIFGSGAANYISLLFGAYFYL